ncbi:MAG: tetraacyldisaccharide 4'-kinase [Candidatus Berkiella sp.]
MKHTIKQKLAIMVLDFWHRKSLLSYCLLPLAWAFMLIVKCRYYYYQFKGPISAKVPLIIVGNITVGGTGKTPLVAKLAQFLHENHYKPLILMHGYASHLPKGQTQRVWPSSNVNLVGDEALLMAQNCQDIPVLVTRKRSKALSYIEKYFPDIDVIICDDGLQHYALARDIEIAVIDANRRFGNGFCLPVGPLRESTSRLKQVDFVIAHGSAQKDEYLMKSELAQEVLSLEDENNKCLLERFVGKTVHAVAGIGHPQRFFTMLREKGIEVIEHSFSDHHRYVLSDFHFNQNFPILMTQKDAVKCARLGLKNAYTVSLCTTLDTAFLNNLLRRLDNGQKAARHSGMPHLQATPPV